VPSFTDVGKQYIKTESRGSCDSGYNRRPKGAYLLSEVAANCINLIRLLLTIFELQQEQ